MKSPGSNPVFMGLMGWSHAWLACMVAGAMGTWLAGQILARLGLGATLRPAVLMVPALFALLTCGVWMIFFSAA